MFEVVAPVTVSFQLNGRPVEVTAPPFTRLLDALRVELRVTGPKEGCGEGECGSCGVLIDGELVNSCLVPLAQARGAEVRTVEGLAEDPLGRRLQEAFLEHGGAQCGFCTPGMLMASYRLLQDNPAPTPEEVRLGLAGNLCRCTGYMKIIEAVMAAGEAR